MAWSRKRDVLEGIDPSCPETQPLGFYRIKNEVGVSGENDATVRFLHDLEDLINKYFVDGGLTPLGVDGLEEKNVTILQDDVAELVSPFRDVDSRVHLEVTAVLGVGSAKRDDPASVEEAVRRFVDRRKVFIAHTECKTSAETDIEDSHVRNASTDQGGGLPK